LCKQTFNRFSNRLFSRIDNRLYRINKYYLTDYFSVVVIAVSRQADKTDLSEIARFRLSAVTFGAV